MITSKDAGVPVPTPKRDIASLVGGFVIAIGIFVLWLLVGSQLTGAAPGAALVASGAAIAAVIGAWIRLALIAARQGHRVS
jgi:hypothetical protein